MKGALAVVLVLVVAGAAAFLYLKTPDNTRLSTPPVQAPSQLDDKAGKTRCPMCGSWKYREDLTETRIGRSDRALVCNQYECLNLALKKVEQEEESYQRVMDMIKGKKD